MHARGRYFPEVIVYTTFATLFNRNRRVRFLTYALLTIGERKQLLMVTEGQLKSYRCLVLKMFVYLFHIIF